MAENDLFDQILAHQGLVSRTSNALLTANYLLRHLEKHNPPNGAIFLKALKEQFNLLSLDECEQFMILNPPYWSLYQQLFARYRNLNDNTNQKITS